LCPFNTFPNQTWTDTIAQYYIEKGGNLHFVNIGPRLKHKYLKAFLGPLQISHNHIWTISVLEGSIGKMKALKIKAFLIFFVFLGFSLVYLYQKRRDYPTVKTFGFSNNNTIPVTLQDQPKYDTFDTLSV
jgi:hypothetical protein